MENILEVQNLAFSFNTYAGEVQAVRGVSFSLKEGETLGLVGESGCGKSVTARSIVRLNPPYPTGEVKGGSILFKGRDVNNVSTKEMEEIRAKDIRMIFQDPMTCLNPTMTIGNQISEGILKASKNMSKRDARERAIEMLDLVGIPSPEDRYRQYPHEFSGGMRQRVMIALAIAVTPKLLIADEPTTALDVTTQAQILALIKKMQIEFKTAIIMITHDLGVVASSADKIAIMYAGKITEAGPADEIFERPAHPYTWGLLKSIPRLDSDVKQKLTPILGTPPDLFNPPEGCPFAARCPYAMKICRMYEPGTVTISQEHTANCWLYHEMAGNVLNPITGKMVKA